MTYLKKKTAALFSASEPAQKKKEWMIPCKQRMYGLQRQIITVAVNHHDPVTEFSRVMQLG